MVRLRINWRSVDRVGPRAASTGSPAENAADVKGSTFRAEKPLLVWVTSDDPSDRVMRKCEDVVFANEQVGLGAKFFDTVKMTAGDALQDRIISKAGRQIPRMVFLGRDYKVVAKLEGRGISGGKMLKAMNSAVRKEYATSFETMVRSYRKLLDELDRLDSKRAYIADRKARLAAKPNPSKAKKLERVEKELEQDMADWDKKEQAILQRRTKGGKKAAP